MKRTNLKIIITSTLIFLLITPTALAKNKFYYTVAGGAALGIYEAGFLSYMDLLFKTNHEDQVRMDTDVSHMVGTSAGAYNSLLSLFSKCSLSSSNSIKENIFWKGWVDLGIENMFIKSNVSADQIFTTDGFPILKELRKEWRNGFKKDCEMIMGMAVTRFIPSEVEVNKKITVPNMTEHIVIKVTGQGPGKGPKVENFEFKMGYKRQLLLPFNQDTENNFDLIKDATLASTSYPIAFPPRRLKYCQKKEEEAYFICQSNNMIENYFVDGGVFDNSPILLSYDIARELGINKTGKLIWINPHMGSFEEHLKVVEKRHKSFFDYVGEFTGNFIETSRTRDLSLISSWHPEIKKKILNTTVSLPLMSKPLSAFIGFFERDFRIFDFYTGMVDAHFFFKQIYKKDLPIDLFQEELAPYFCIKEVLKQTKDLGKFCDEKKIDRNFLVLLQTSITLLYNHCSSRRAKPPRDDSLCAEAFKGKGPGIILNNFPSITNWKKDNEEEQLDYVFRILNFLSFEFKDLKLKKEESHKGQFALRKKVGDIYSTYMNKLPSSEQNILRRAGDTFLNQKIYYTPVENALYLTLGRAFEFGYNFKRIDFVYPSFLKLTTGLLFQGGYDLINGNRDVYALSPLLGTEYEFSFSNYKWQYFLGIKAGYQFSNGDGCNNPDDPNIMIQCNGLTILPYLGLSFLELLRFHILYNWLPDYNFGKIRNNILLQLGVQF